MEILRKYLLPLVIGNKYSLVPALISNPQQGIILRKRKRFTLPLLEPIILSSGFFAFLIATFIFISWAGMANAQTAPVISYTPNTYTLTQNTAMSPSATITNTGGAVAGFSYGTGTGITGGGLNHPYGVAVDASGNVYVANYGNDVRDGSNSSISKYNVSTHTWTSPYLTDSISNPQGLAFDATGNLYVLNYARTNNGVGNSHGNAYVTEYNSSGVLMTTVVSGLGTANGIAVDPLTGNIDVAEGSYNTGNTVVNEYTNGGALNFTISNATIPNPVNVATDGSGNMYVLNNSTGGGSNQVVKFSSTGTYISTLISTGLTNPFGIYVDGSGNIYVSDSTGGTTSIKVYNAAGTQIATLSGLTSPQGLATDSKGNLFVSDYTNNTLTEYPPTGGYYISSKLPPGLTFDYTTGTISGTPTTAFASTTYYVTAYNASGISNSTPITLSCTANALAPTIVYNTFPVNVYTTNNLITPLVPSVTNGAGATYTLTGILPAGLSFSASTGQFTGTPTAVKTATLYTVTITNNGFSASTTVSIATVVAVYWTGKTNTSWEKNTNWSTNKVPLATDYVSIGEQPYTGVKAEPTISATTGNVTAAYLTLGSTHQPTLTVTGQTLTVSNILTVNDNATPTITGTGTVNVAATGVVHIVGTGTLAITSPLTFTLKSTATSSASVGQIASGSIVGNVAVERYIPGGTGYRGYILLSSPVNYGTPDSYGNNIYSINYLLNSTFITGTNFATTTFSKSGNPSLYLYRENLVPSNASFTSGNYRGISDISTSPYYTLNGDGSGYDIPVGNGYLMFFRGGTGTVNPYTTTSTPAAATLTATGALNQGSITFKHWYTPNTSGLMNTTLSGDPTIEGFNLVGNPYACTIDLSTYATGGISMTNISKFVYELDPSSKNYGIYAVDGSVVPSNHASRYIVSGQGFFVLALTSSSASQLTFNESSKVENIQNTGLNLLLGKPPVANNTQYLRLQMALDSVNSDETIVQFNTGAKSAYVFNEDAPYRVGTGKVSLSSISGDNKALAINRLPLSDGLTIPLKIGATAAGNYTMNLKDITGVPALYDIWLKDAFTKDSVNMRAAASYSFSITADTSSTGSKRFTLMVKQNPAFAYQLLSFNAQKLGSNSVQATWTAQNEENYTDFTVERSNDGGKTYNAVGSLTSSGLHSYSIADLHPHIGDNIYRLQSVDYNNAVTYSSTVDIQFINDSKTGNVSCFPNPTVNSINVTILSKSQGDIAYDIKVTNSMGLLVKHTTLSGTNWENSVSDLLPGTYLVQVTNAKNNEFVGQTKFVKL